MTKKKMIELLQSGDFTLAYHDNGYCTLHKGKSDEYEDVKGKGAEFTEMTWGYETAEVKALVEALGGKVVSV